MRYAIFADIHGNLSALQAALDHARDANAYIFAGDYYMYTPFANEVADLMRSIPNAYIVRGNGEDYLSMLERKPRSEWTDGQMAALYWNYDHITSDNRAYLTSLPNKLVIHDSGVRVRVQHALNEFHDKPVQHKLWSDTYRNRHRGKSHDQYVADVTKECLDDPAFVKPIAALDCDVLITGHTHVQVCMKIAGVTLINPGSCGTALDGDNRAAYTVLDIRDDGSFAVEERRAAYDIDALVDAVRASDCYRVAKPFIEIAACMSSQYAVEHLDGFFRYAEAYARRIGDDRRPFAHDTWNAAFAAWQGEGCPI